LETYKNITENPKNKQICNTSRTMGKNDKEIVDLFAEHLSEVFSIHNNDQDQEVKQDLAISYAH
jgi:hypothetical protein